MADSCSPGETVLPFGRHRGSKICDIPFEYLRWLAHWDLSYDERSGQLHKVCSIVDKLVRVKGYILHAKKEPRTFAPDALSVTVTDADNWLGLFSAPGISVEMLCERILADAPRIELWCGSPTGYLWKIFYTFVKQRDSVNAARAYMSASKICFRCGGRLVPIGDCRANGKAHPDWNMRLLHKKCFVEYIRSKEA